MSEKKTAKIFTDRGFAILIIFVAIVGIIASLVLTLDKIHVIKDPNYNPACNINPVFSCGSVMRTGQSEIAGVPNTIVGLMAFPALMMVGVSMLFGAKYNKNFWILFKIVALLGLFGVFYLFFQGVYRINALCLYCMSVWVVVLLLNWYALLWNFKHEYFKPPNSMKKYSDFALKHHVDILIVFYLILTALILNHFWYYFKTIL